MLRYTCQQISFDGAACLELASTDAVTASLASRASFACKMLMERLTSLPEVPLPLARPSRTAQSQGGRRRTPPPLAALRIDRGRHLELAWQRQQVEDTLQAQEATCCPVGCVAEVRGVAHLEQRVESAGSSVVVVAFYSRSCGVCKQMLRHFSRLCKEASRQSAGAVFLQHNVRDDFDDLSDVARLHRVRHVPCFVFFVGGAQKKRVDMVDSRDDAAAVKRLMGWQRGRLEASLREVLWREAPSARR